MQDSDLRKKTRQELEKIAAEHPSTSNIREEARVELERREKRKMLALIWTILVLTTVGMLITVLCCMLR